MSSYRNRLARILNDREEEIDEEVHRRMEAENDDDYDKFHKEVLDEIEDSLVDSMIDWIFLVTKVKLCFTMQMLSLNAKVQIRNSSCSQGSGRADMKNRTQWAARNPWMFGLLLHKHF